MNEFQQALEFIEHVDSTSGLDELRERLAATLEKFDVPNYSMIAMVSERGEPRAPTVLLKRSDEGWADNYLDRGHYNIDPAIHGALKSPYPFTWADIESGRLSKEARHLFEEIREAMPVKGGLVIPTHDEEGFAGLLALYHEGRDLSQKAKAALKLISLYAVERAKELYAMRAIDPAQNVCPLTGRQREILSFVADGKSDWDIGAILNIASATVNEHVENAKEAIGVKTRTQAVAIAIRRGWIKLG